MALEIVAATVSVCRFRIAGYSGKTSLMFVAATKRSAGSPSRFAIRPAVRFPKLPLGVQKISSAIGGRELWPCAEVVENLGQEPSDVDRVGRGRGDAAAKIVIRKRGLGKPLALIEGPLDGQGVDVVAEGGELPFLEGAHLPIRKEDDDPGAFETQKCIGDRAPRVSDVATRIVNGSPAGRTSSSPEP